MLQRKSRYIPPSNLKSVTTLWQAHFKFNEQNSTFHLKGLRTAIQVMGDIQKDLKLF